MRVGFFSTMAGMPWGGSEELWVRAATHLLDNGHEVAFNCVKWPSVAAPLQKLMDAGAKGDFRSRRNLGRTLTQALQKLKLSRLKYLSWLRSSRPDFMVISFAGHTDDPQIANSCSALGIPYAIVLQAAGVHTWIAPWRVDEYRTAYLNAKRTFFVSAENRETIESNLAIEVPRSEIADNPFIVSVDAAPPWPSTTTQWKLACVARIQYITKSQDLILRVMRMPKWRTRPLHVSLYGGDNGSLGLVRRALDIYGLHRQVSYGGVSNNIEQLWAEHHGLLLPSRAEGNPLSLVEAMICGRVPITTNLGRAGELIDDNESGFIAAAPTVELLDEAMERAWQRRDDWRIIGQRAAKAIRARHSLRPGEDFAERIVDVASGKQAIRKLAA
ncbi:MAG TPA: glycosyltransferase family 4 protein [Lacipirellulaceae bacterium]|jgi:glycosyltransferase involved in cell wall biosynthesis|nr:glycosyltransferase family 4 protein [Lacipirellulaceae bacterium]